MFDKMKQLMEMKRQADQIKKELDASSIDIEEVRGIKLTINGAQQIQSVTIDEDLLSKDNKVNLQRDLKRCFNAAVKKAQEEAAQKMKAVMPNIPGL